MTRHLPKSNAEFHQLMETVDQELISENTKITARPLKAIGKLSKKLGIPLPLTPPVLGMEKNIAQHWPFAQKAMEWFRYWYGDRLKVDFSIGRIVLALRGDPWIIRLPRLFGCVQLVSSRTLVSEQMKMDGSPLVFNVIDSIEGLSIGLKESLTDDEMDTIFNHFKFGLDAYAILDSLRSISLIDSAFSDLNSSVENIVRQNPNFGLSKWASLQATEKVLKAGIEALGITYLKTHDLNKLINQFRSRGIELPLEGLIDQIKCKPAIRYSDDNADFSEAVKAHHAAIRVCGHVAKYIEVWQKNERNLNGE